MRRAAPLLILAVLFVAVTLGVTTGSGLLVDWLWFNMLGFGAVFVTTWGTKLITFGVVAVLSAALLALNGVLAARTQPPPQPRRLRVMRGNGVEGLPDILELSPENLPWRLIVVALAVVLGLFIGVAQAGNWETFLNWLYGVPFGRSDPLFGKDLGFYVFVLPAYGIVRDWGILMVFLAVFMAGGVYWARGAIDVESGTPRVSPAAVRHLSALLAIFFIVKTADYFLQRYDLLLSNTGVVFGAAYTDVYVRLPP